MSTSEEVLDHLSELRATAGSAINTVRDYQTYGSKLTSGNAATERAKVTTIPSVRQHASDCAICTAWDGS